MISTLNLKCMKTRLPGTLYCFLTATLLLLSSASTEAQGVYRFWGMTRQGGQHNTGVLFSLDSSATQYNIQHDFTLSNPGASPYHTRLTKWNEKFYGVTIGGGDNNNYGVIFEWDATTNTYTNRYNFAGDDCWFVYGSLTLLNDKFYGMTNRGGDYGLGVIFEWDPATNVFTRLYHFNDESGHSPEGSLTVKSGKLYGMTRAGGDFYGGTIFKFDPVTNEFSKKYDFDYADGKGPHSDLTLADGRFFGLTSDGGANGYGVVFEWNPVTNVYTKHLDFDGSNGKYAYGSLTSFHDKLYGLTSEGGSQDAGILFEFDPVANIISKTVSFGGANGSNPYGSLTAGDETLVGATWMGGPGNYGVLFEYDPSVNSIVHTRELADQLNGTNPLGSLLCDGGSFYGLTSSGGAANSGVIFKWIPTTGSYDKKIDFNIAENGALPQGTLVKWAGRLYGTASSGGTANKGVLFSYDEATQQFTRLFNFDGEHGAMPTGDLIVYNGRLYGWTREGGDEGRGTIFEWNFSAQTLQVLHSFRNSDGSYPSAGPLLWNNKFYGTTTEGGINGYGVIYEFDPVNAAYTRRYDFDGAGGANPTGYLAVRNNLLFGTTTYGGLNETGVIYEWNPGTGNYSTRYHFEVQGMGVHPRGGLTLSYAGDVFYGMTRETNGNISFPGQEGAGVLFEWNPENGAYRKKIDFDGENGGLPVGNLSLSGGKYYGMTSQGGIGESYPGINFIVGGSGIIFEWDAANNIIEKKIDLLGDNGAYPSGNNLARATVPVANGSSNNCEAINSVVIDAANNNKWVALTDSKGNVVAEIHANGNNLGTVSGSLFINEGAVREDSKKRLYLNRSITITPSVQPATSVGLRLYINRQEFVDLKSATNSAGKPSGINFPADLSVFKLDNACGEVLEELTNRQTTTAGNWSADYVYNLAVTSFSTFYFSAAGSAEAPLPVEFISFTATLAGDDVDLKWETARERDILRFDVEKSIDGIDYTVIGNSNPFNTTGAHSYKYTDSEAALQNSGKIYYRIREVDMDGSSTYSRAVMVSLPDKPAHLVFYPNPVESAGQLKLQWNRTEKLLVRILDNSGRVLRQVSWQAQPGTSYLPVNMEKEAAGIYLVEVRGTNWKQLVRLLKR